MVIDRRRERQLAGERRAGAWAHRKAVERQWRFVRENRWRLCVFLGIYVVLLPAAWLQRGDFARGAYVGGVTVAVGATMVLLVWQLSGVAHLQQGELAEQWTVQALRPLTKSAEWRLINHVLLRPWDIDHVLIGPVGIVVIETKGGSSDWTERRHEPRIQAAASQVRSNSRDIRLFVQPDIGRGALVYPVVALWPAQADLERREIDGVTVLSGHELCSWIATLPASSLSEDPRAAAWSRIERHLDRRDAADLERHGRAPRTLNQILWDGSQYPLGMALVFAGLPPLLEQFSGETEPFVVAIVAVLAAVGARRISRLRHLFRGALLATAAVAVIVALKVLAAAS